MQQHHFVSTYPPDDNMQSVDAAGAAARLLRIIISNNGPTAHATLRAKALAGDAQASSKCAVDMALLTLVEHGLLTKIGAGNWAMYTVPLAALPVANEIAYADFQEDTVTSPSSASSAQHPTAVPLQQQCIAGKAAMMTSPRPQNPCSLNSMRRLSSPRSRPSHHHHHHSRTAAASDRPAASLQLHRVRPASSLKRGAGSSDDVLFSNTKRMRIARSGGSSAAAAAAAAMQVAAALDQQHVDEGYNADSNDGDIEPMSP